MKNINKNKVFIGSLLCSCLIGVLIFIVADCKYAINDDLIISMIANGVYGEEYSHCLIFSSSLFGWVLRLLNMMFNNVNWYMLFQYINIWISISVLTTIVYSITSNVKISIISFAGFWVLLFYDIYIEVTFTSTAGICGLIGLIGIIEFHSNGKLMTIMSIILALFGFIYRQNSFLLSVPFGCLYLLFSIKRKGVIYNKLIKYIFVLLILIGVCVAVDIKTYRSDNWKDYLERNKIRATLQDYDIKIPAEKLNDAVINWSDNDFKVFKALKNDSKEKFSLNNLKKLSLIAEKQQPDIVGIANDVKEFYFYTFSPAQIIAFIVLAIAMIVVTREAFVKLIVINLLSIAICAYLIYEGRYPYRVSIIVWAGTNILMLSELLRSGLQVNRKTAAIILSLLIIIFSVKIIKNKKETNSNEYDLIGTISKDKNHLYIVDIFSFGESNNLRPLDKIPSDYLDNILILGGWMCQSPLTENVCSKHGANNTLDILGTRDDVFYVMQEIDDVKIIEKYLQENYNESISCEVAERLGGGYVSYRFVRD